MKAHKSAARSVVRKHAAQHPRQEPELRPPSPLESRLNAVLPILGHRNWIVLADSAYPAQTSPGIESIHTPHDLTSTLETVLHALDRSRHVRPVMHLDSELDVIPDSMAPGIDDFRKALRRLLSGRDVKRAPHAELIQRLEEAGQRFRVLVLKTDLILPYTSVFMELDCGYWSPEQEGRLRELMRDNG